MSPYIEIYISIYIPIYINSKVTMTYEYIHVASTKKCF